MARPTNDPKECFIGIRINEETNSRLTELAKENGLSVSEYIRNIISPVHSYNHKDALISLLDFMSDARICAGAEFEALLNERKNEEAVIFELMRDTLQAQCTILKDYIKCIKKYEL